MIARSIPILLIALAIAAVATASWYAGPQVLDQKAAPPHSALDKTGSTEPPPSSVIAREGCVTPTCHPGIKDRPFLHGPVQVNGCDGCHTLVDPVKHAFQPVASREAMCALCHMPEVSESPVLHEPFAKGDCLSCHDPHGSSEARLLRGERYADACLTCHKDMTGGHDQVHGPASVGACGACHEPHASKLPKLLNAEGRDLCLTCHVRTAVEIEQSSVVHAPVLGECRVCHDPHATDNASILIEEPSKLCLNCHQDIADTVHSATTQHAAVTTKRACLNCHSPHAGNHASLLRDDVKLLCFECHNQPIKMEDGSTLVNMKSVIETGKSLHGAVTQRSCAECHEIHGGGHKRLLNNEYPSDLYYPFGENAYALCFSCHDRQLVLLPHTDSATGFRNGTTNLHYVHVNQDKKGRSCRMCHDTHAANREKHIRDDVPYGPSGWKLPIGYQQSVDGGSCAGGCHPAYAYSRVEAIPHPPVPAGAKEGAWKGTDLIPGSRAEPPTSTKSEPPKSPGSTTK
ncbi:MAG: hypothetical protein JNL80_10225 [Phycisphaerae bacterium]|jgi:predicted CXXCH cytochrome family protein|nr:hypothetical protein [Phycisphaerae bacterium]